ncbi:MAG TPA: UDP-N-acetylmuramate--L-alanine ligase [Candidatus Hydrogenedentes bacterium]|nr:UDP-N-acetylmuramate--L-alanine ligase [Candidatus Hydrogenedentota bacterium]
MTGLKRKVHFVGVGGIGMSGLAEILLNLGYEVSGSDLSASDITERLIALGLRFHEGHMASQVGDADILVISAAVKPDNPEVVAARERGVPVIQRSELLADLMRLKPNAIAVGGTHGKTTTTSMVSAILDHANIGATSIIGGILHRSGTNARWGTGDYLVAEADEHDGSFLRLHPTISVVTSVDAEHLEYYGTLDKIQRAFTQFCNMVPFYGFSIVCWDDENTRAFHPSIDSICVTYGTGEGAGLRGSNATLVVPDKNRSKAAQLSNLRTRFDVTSYDERLHVKGKLGSLTCNAIGEHNVRNALAACAVGLCLGMKFPHIADGLKLYDGVQRRLQVCGEVNGVTVVEDYAHHPTEIASTLEAVRWVEPKRVIGIFQPHLYSRTKFFYTEFASVLAQFDRAIVTDIYPSREEPMPGVDSGLIVDEVRRIGSGSVELIKDMNAVPAAIASALEPGDVVLILGAGNINRIAQPLLAALGAR